MPYEKLGERKKSIWPCNNKDEIVTKFLVDLPQKLLTLRDHIPAHALLAEHHNSHHV